MDTFNLSLIAGGHLKNLKVKKTKINKKAGKNRVNELYKYLKTKKSICSTSLVVFFIYLFLLSLFYLFLYFYYMRSLNSGVYIYIKQ